MFWTIFRTISTAVLIGFLYSFDCYPSGDTDENGELNVIDIVP